MFEDIYQTFGYDGDGNRLFSTVTITKYAPPFEGDMPLPPGKEKTNNGKGKGNDKKQLSLMSVPELVIYLAKSDNGKGKGGGGNNGKGSDNSKGNSSHNGKDNNGNVYGKTKEKTNNGLHLGWYKRPDHPHYPGDMHPGWQVEEEFRVTNYVNDINRDYPEVLMVSDEEGSYTASYLYGIERIMAENVEGLQPDRFDPLYYLYDGLGSATQLVNGDGEVWNKFMYEPYGRPKAAGKLLLNRHKEELLYVPFGFTGEAHDFYSGLIYLRARYYDPEVGSFISRDSYLGNLMRPLSQNRYTYVENNPINYIDPSGHELIGPFDHTIIPGYTPNLDTLKGISVSIPRSVTLGAGIVRGTEIVRNIEGDFYEIYDYEGTMYQTNVNPSAELALSINLIYGKYEEPTQLEGISYSKAAEISFEDAVAIIGEVVSMGAIPPQLIGYILMKPDAFSIGIQKFESKEGDIYGYGLVFSTGGTGLSYADLDYKQRGDYDTLPEVIDELIGAKTFNPCVIEKVMDGTIKVDIKK